MAQFRNTDLGVVKIMVPFGVLSMICLIREPESPIWHNYGIQIWVVVKIVVPFGVLSVIRVSREPESPIWFN